MIKNYLKIAIRNLQNSKVYSVINILGLAVGMSVALLIGLWIYDELSYNKHHKNYNTLYQIKMHQTFDGRRGTQDAIPYGTGSELKNKYSDFAGVAMCDWGGNRSLVVKDQKFLKKGHFIGEDAISMFSIPILNGDKNPLKEPYSIVLTKETAEALFGNENPIGKVVRMDNKVDLQVTAVVEAQPKNATLQFDYLLPWHLQLKMYDWMKWEENNWGNNSYQAYVQLKDNISPEATNARIKNLILDHFQEDPLKKNSIKPEVFIFPMAKWRLYSNFKDGFNTGGFIKYVRLFAIFGLCVLAIACINFMNLSTARSAKRTKEVGVRKAVGSGREQLIIQFLSESMVITFIALLLSVLLVQLALPFFNTLTEKSLSLGLANPVIWGILILFAVLTGLLAGSYPALYLSSFNPVRVLKGLVHVGKGAALPRQILVVVQFSFSIVLMIGTIIIYQQIQYGKNRPIGFNKSGIVTIESSENLYNNRDVVKNELLNTGVVSSVSTTNSPPTEIYSRNSDWQWKGSTPEDKAVIFATVASGYDYTQTMGIKMKEGRDFSPDFPSDSNAVILNEAAVKRMKLKNPVGEIVKWGKDEKRIVGVMPDVMLDSPFGVSVPLTLVFAKNWMSYFNIRINPDVSASVALEKIKPIFDKYNPGFPFTYQFADTEYAKKFNYEELIGNLSAIVSVLAIFISCLGLFGLASFMAEQRTKEIGIRKVLGASVSTLWGLLSRDFVKLVLISFLIAAPAAYYVMTIWLEDYKNYMIKIQPWVFVLVLVLLVTITLITVSYKAIRAAMLNPVKALRSE